MTDAKSESGLAHEPQGLFDDEPGTTVTFEMDDEQVMGEVKDVERGTPADDWPEPGENVTFKAVSGEIEKTVHEVNPDDEYPIVMKNGSRCNRTNLVEYTETQRYRIVELADGREIWPSIENNNKEDTA